MAYCKNCGNAIKDDETFCPTCGYKVEKLEVVDESQVEIVRRKKERTQFSLRAGAYSKELTDNTFTVFDKKVVVALCCVLLFSAISFFIRTLDAGSFRVLDIVEAVALGCMIVGLLLPCLLKNRGLMILMLLVAAVLLLLDTVKILVGMNVTSTTFILRAVMSAVVSVAFMVECVVLSVEMLTGKRALGTHCVLVVVVAVGVLASLILTLLATPDNELGILVAVWQVMSVFSRIMQLCIIIFLFSNLGRVGLKDRF